MKMARTWLIVMAAALVTSAAARGADDGEIALQRALDQPLTLSLHNVSLAEALKQIAATAKIPLQVDPACYDLLPYGETMLVSVTFKESKLRESLDVLLIPMGLQTTIAGSAVMIRPSNPLKYIGHRADWEELKLLKELWGSAELKMPASGPFKLTEAIRAAMEGRKDLIVSLPGETGGAGGGPATGTAPAQEAAVQQIAKQLPMSAYRALDLYCQLTNTVWFVEAGPMAGGATGGKIVVMTPRQWIGRQLGQPIQISRKDQPLEVIVADLTRESGIRFVPEPGLYQAVPVVSLRSDNGTVLQTLEALAGFTRIAFDIRDDSILLRLSGGPGNQSKSDAIVGKIGVPIGPEGATMDVYIHESDLTTEQNELRKKKIDEAVKEMQKTWSKAPATAAPATGPAAKNE
jgi:hypothetical protein